MFRKRPRLAFVGGFGYERPVHADTLGGNVDVAAPALAWQNALPEDREA